MTIQNALTSTLRVGAETAGGAAHLLIDVTIGRLLDTNPDKVR